MVFTLLGPQKLNPKRVEKASKHVWKCSQWLKRFDELVVAKEVEFHKHKQQYLPEQDYTKMRSEFVLTKDLGERFDELYRDAAKQDIDFLLQDDCWEEDTFLRERAAKAAEGSHAGMEEDFEPPLMTAFAHVWNGKYDDVSIRVEAKGLRKGWQILVAGEMTYGDTPDTYSYKVLDLACALGIFPILGID